MNRWGMHFSDGKTYDGVLWARAEKNLDLFVALESRDGLQSRAEQRLTVKGGDWRR